ncbi:MAG: paraquat-inducible protein A [Planctomycetota bacterium]
MIVACHDCDLLLTEPDLEPGRTAVCPRCGATLVRRRENAVERTLALTIAGLVLFAVANLFPFLTMEVGSQATHSTLATGSFELIEGGQTSVGLLVLLTTVIAPMAQLVLLLYVLGPLHRGRVPRAIVPAFRWVQRAKNWSMMEVFLLGILVSLVKLMDMASIVPGVALWAFVLLIPVLAAASSSLDPHEIWEHVEVDG